MAETAFTAQDFVTIAHQAEFAEQVRQLSQLAAQRQLGAFAVYKHGEHFTRSNIVTDPSRADHVPDGILFRDQHGNVRPSFALLVRTQYNTARDQQLLGRVMWPHVGLVRRSGRWYNDNPGHITAVLARDPTPYSNNLSLLAYRQRAFNSFDALPLAGLDPMDPVRAPILRQAGLVLGALSFQASSGRYRHDPSAIQKLFPEEKL